MYLSYSGFKGWESCPRLYWHKYVNKTTLEVKDNRVNMLYGGVVGYIFECFYKEKLWRYDDVLRRLLERVQPTIDRVIQEESRSGVFDWKDPKLKERGPHSVDEVRVEVEETVKRGLAIIRYHRLLGTVAEAEYKLDGDLFGHRFGGRADFLIRRLAPHNDLVMIDGKGSRWRDQYVDRRQLKWYAWLYQHHHKSLPDRIGFLYWRSEPEDSLDWVDFTQKDIDILSQAVQDAVAGIGEAKRHLSTVPVVEAFQARPCRDCNRCNFLSVCNEGTVFVKTKNSPPIPQGGGVEDVGL